MKKVSSRVTALFPNLYKYFVTKRRRNFANTQEVMAMFAPLDQCIIIIIIIIIIVLVSSYKFEDTLIDGRIKIRLEKAAKFSQLYLWSFKSSETWRRIVGRVIFDVSIDRSGAILLGLHYIKDEGTLTFPNIRKYSPRDTVSHPRREIIIITIIIICF